MQNPKREKVAAKRKEFVRNTFFNMYLKEELTCCLRIVISSPPMGPKASNSASLAIVHSANSRNEINKAFQWSELFSRRFLWSKNEQKLSGWLLYTNVWCIIMPHDDTGCSTMTASYQNKGYSIILERYIEVVLKDHGFITIVVQSSCVRRHIFKMMNNNNAWCPDSNEIHSDHL